MKRTYLKVPGQSVKISVSGPSGCGKTQIIDKLSALFAGDGLIAEAKDGEFIGGVYVERLIVKCPTPAQAQAMYFETLDEQQRETLRGHLSALGYEL